MALQQVRPEPVPKGDVALLVAVIAVGLWPYLALLTGAAPPAWELGVGAVFALLASGALARALAGDR